MADHPFPDPATLTDQVQRHLADLLTFAQAQPVSAALAVGALVIALATAIILFRLARARKDEAGANSAAVQKRAPAIDLKKAQEPVLRTDQKPDPAPERVTRPAPSRVGGRPLVLHVDDSPSTLRLIAQAFSARADVVSVASASEAIREIEATRPDVVILEAGLTTGGVDGFLAHLRAAAEAPPLVLFSARAPSAGEAHAAMVFSKSRTTLGELVTGTLALTAATPRNDLLRQA